MLAILTALIVAFVSSLLSVLTERQVDSIILLAGKLIDHVPAILGLIGTGFLIVRQWLNTRNVTKKLDENTELTKGAAKKAEEVQATLEVITDADQLRSMTTLAKRLGSTEPVFYSKALPGPDYEVFDLAEGAEVKWKSEPCEQGRQVRFLVSGVCAMGFHFHKVAEILSGVRGKLFYETREKTVVLGPGDTYRTEADEVHSARFEAPGEVVVHWPDQLTDNLEIGIWP